MRTNAIQAALGALSLWASLGAAQQELPRIALKLSPSGQEHQQADPNFIASLIESATPSPPGPQSFAASSSSSTTKVSVSPLIGSASSRRLLSRIARGARANSNIPKFDTWYQIEVGSGSASEARDLHSRASDNTTLSLPPDTLALIHALHALPDVASVHAMYPGPPPAVNPNDDPRRSNQGYLNAAPQGINAPYGWAVNGGDGKSVNIVDVEQGWNFNHEDLAAAGITLISGRNAAYYSHGTAVLGEMFMVDNQLGGIGIVPAAKGRAVSQHRTQGGYNTAEAILDAADHMSPGDIMLLEAQEYDPVSGAYYWPVEVADANFEAIQAASEAGIIVVQAGCNGANDLDAYTNLSGKRIFNRNSADFRDSGSIMVGGSNPGVPHTRWGSTNYGTRVDVYAWAAGIDTAYSDDNSGTQSSYTTGFGGTSGASPIVVGAAAIVQGISVARNNAKYGPAQMRQILSSYGTASANPSSDRIGVMPDLKKIIDAIF